MTLQERRKESLEIALYEYLNSVEQIEDMTIKLIDNKCTKHDMIYIFSKHKKKLQKLEMCIKKF